MGAKAMLGKAMKDLPVGAKIIYYLVVTVFLGGSTFGTWRLVAANTAKQVEINTAAIPAQAKEFNNKLSFQSAELKTKLDSNENRIDSTEKDFTELNTKYETAMPFIRENVANIHKRVDGIEDSMSEQNTIQGQILLELKSLNKNN